MLKNIVFLFIGWLISAIILVPLLIYNTFYDRSNDYHYMFHTWYYNKFLDK